MSTARVAPRRFTVLSLLAVGLIAADLASTASATMVTYNFAGIISGGSGSSNTIPVDLQGQFSIGQPVTLTYVIDTSTAQSTAPPLNTYPSMGYYPDAVDTWSLTYGTYTASGTGGYATVCDSTNTEGLNANCPNPRTFPGSLPVAPTMACASWVGQPITWPQWSMATHCVPRMFFQSGRITVNVQT